MAAFFIGAVSAAHARTCRIVFPQRPADFPEEVHLYDGTTSHSVVLPSMNFSPVIELPDGNLTLHLSPKAVTTPQALSKKAPSLQIPENVTSFYLLIISNPDNPFMAVKLRLVDTSEDKLSPGQTIWLNMTEHPVEANLGDARLSIAGQGQAISEKPQATSGYYLAKFAMRLREQDQLQPLTEQRWWNDNNSRYMGIILDNGAKLPEVHLFRDFRAPAPAPEPTP